MKTAAELAHKLRNQVVGSIHTGQLHPGDRLPGLRRTASKFAVNPRTVASAYRELADEGLVEIRERTGVFVAPQQLIGSGILEETTRWLSGVLVQAWQRGISFADLPPFVARYTCAKRPRCGLVDDVEDGIVAFTHELTRCGFSVQVLAPHELRRSIERRRRGREAAVNEGIDVFVASTFHAQLARDAAHLTGKEFVLLTIDSAIREAVQRQLSAGRLTIVASDPAFEERIRIGYDVKQPSRIEFVQADDMEAVRRIDPTEPVLLTRAGSARLRENRLSRIYDSGRILSSETVASLASTLVSLNVGLDAQPR